MRTTATAAGTAPAMTKGRRPPIRVRRLSDHAPAMSGIQSAMMPSLPTITPMTAVVCVWPLVTSDR